MDKQFSERMTDGLIWLPELGIGYYPVVNQKVDYFDDYTERSESPIAQALNDFRVNLVNKYTEGPVLDFGIGSGSFIGNRTYKTFGYDIDPKSVAWLKKKNLYLNPYEVKDVAAITFFDSLEHVQEPHKILLNVAVGGLIFISVPIFKDCNHVLYSKHFKPNEHVWYFTWSGLVKWVCNYGYEFVESSEKESKLGREDIGTFVFRRKKSCK
jgi:hypothetical protein